MVNVEVLMNINEVLALEESFGTQMNVIKDVSFEGRILEQIQSAVAYIQTQIKERTYLTSGGVFTTEQEYPEFGQQKRDLNNIIQESNFGKSIKTKLSKILADIEKNQVISAKDVMKSLDCKPTAATENIKRLVSLGSLKKSKGSDTASIF